MTEVMAPETPKWLDRNFLQDILRTREKDPNLEVTHCDIKPPIAKGDNYASTILGASLIYKTQEAREPLTRSLIIKALPEGEFMQKFINEMKIFDRENEMILKIIPTMEELYQKVTGKKLLIAAKGLSSPIQNSVVLEDLRPEGFQMANRASGLDLDHAKLAWKTLGKFHGLSYALNKKNKGNLEKDFPEHMYTETSCETIGKFYNKAFKDLSEVIEKWPEASRFAPKLLQFSDTLTQNLTNMAKLKENDFAVLLHGDFWVNNMLFKYQDGNVEDIRFLDFQLTRWNNPAFDLHYFFYSSIQDEIRENHADELLHDYYDSLKSNLSLLNCDVEYSFDDLMKDFNEKGLFGVVIASTLMPIIKANKEDAPELKNLKEEDIEKGNFDIMTNLYNSKQFRKSYPLMLQNAERRGFI